MGNFWRRGLDTRICWGFEGHGAKNIPGLNPLDSIDLIQGMNPLLPPERQKRSFSALPGAQMRGTWGTRQKDFSDHAIVLIEGLGERRLGRGGSSKLEGKGIEMRRYFWMAVAGGAWAAWAAVACGAQSTPAAATAPTASPAATPRHSPAAALVPCSVAPQPVPCGTTPAVSGKQSATEQFPFPDEASGVELRLRRTRLRRSSAAFSQTADAPGALRAQRLVRLLALRRQGRRIGRRLSISR